MNLGFPELIALFVVALLLFGPKRLPELAKNLGKGIRDFKKAVAGDEDDAEKKTAERLPENTQPRQSDASHAVPDKEKEKEKV